MLILINAIFVINIFWKILFMKDRRYGYGHHGYLKNVPNVATQLINNVFFLFLMYEYSCTSTVITRSRFLG